MKPEELGAFLVRASLYRVEQIEGARISVGKPWTTIPAPREVRRHCERCGGERNWAKQADPGPNHHVIRGGFDDLIYTCNDCGKEVFRVWVRLRIELDKGVSIEKIGQNPKLEVTLPKEFEDALGKDATLYRRAMTSRHSNYGIGAHAYLRRVVENTTDHMLTVLEKAMIETRADPAAIQHFREARAGRSFEDKIKLAGEVIPDHLKPGGMNPFGDLHDLLSVGLHALTDEECCDLVDSMDDALQYVYTELKPQADSAVRYRDAAIKIHKTVEKYRRSE
jgi:hypothetical protein